MQNIIQNAKKTVLEFQRLVDNSSLSDLPELMSSKLSETYHWRGMHPFMNSLALILSYQLFTNRSELHSHH